MEISRTALRKLMLLITFAILLYTGLQHLSQVLGFFRFVGGVVSPLLIGGATAFVLNVPMAFFEKKLFTPPPGGGRRRRRGVKGAGVDRETPGSAVDGGGGGGGGGV